MWHRAVVAFRRICSGDLSYFGGPTVAEAVAERLRAEQVGTIIHYLPWMMLANASNALVLLAAFWTSPDLLWAAGWASCVVLYAAIFGIRSLRRRRPPAPP